MQEGLPEKSQGNPGEPSVRLGDALGTEVWKCQLSTCQKETGESPPEQKVQLVRTNPQRAGVFHAACVSLD